MERACLSKEVCLERDPISGGIVSCGEMAMSKPYKSSAMEGHNMAETLWDQCGIVPEMTCHRS